VVAEPGERDRVEGAVELTVAAAVEPVADGLAGGGGDGCGAGEGGEGGFGAEAAGMLPGAEELRGGDRADAGLGEERGRERADELVQLRLELGCLSSERERATGG